MAVQRHHFAVQAVVGAAAEIPVLLQLAETEGAVIDSQRQCVQCGHLEKDILSAGPTLRRQLSDIDHCISLLVSCVFESQIPAQLPAVEPGDIGAEPAGF